MNNVLGYIWDYLVDNNIATDDEIQLVTDINGLTEETLNDIIYARTGYHNIEQLEEAGDEY